MTTSDEPATLLAVQAGVATLTLNVPDKMNPLSSALREGMLAALEQVQGDEAVRVLVIEARGRGFCVGADLGELLAAAGGEAGPAMQEQITRLMDDFALRITRTLRALRVPVICAVDGVVAGGGVGLALAGDIVIATRGSYFYLPFVPALGMVPDMGASWFLPRAIGRARAVGMTLLGRRVSAEQAAGWGLTWACVDDAQSLVREVSKISAQLALLPPHSAPEVRALFCSAESATLEEQLSYERDRQVALSAGPAFGEGVSAFIAKRPPDFYRR